MKLISWNLNGIRKTWDKGLRSLLAEADADIYAFQETRVSEPYTPAEIKGYYSYWSFCTSKKGYSGTMCLTRMKPIAVSYDMTLGTAECISDATFDLEGRIITLEFENYYFVNVYYPNSQASSARYEYRNQWDARFTKYLFRLQTQKPTIVCGDFNATASDQDIYASNHWVELNAEGYQATEREQLLHLLQSGFTDTYRYLHPNEINAFSWWSNRLKKRSENKGWRLDYILVTDNLSNNIKDANILTDVRGSDHCPVFLEIDDKTLAIEHTPGKKWVMKEPPPQDRGAVIQALLAADLGAIWDDIDWQQVEDEVTRMQMGIAKAAYLHDADKIKRRQFNLVCSLEAKLLAVRHISSTSPSPGVDKITWKTSREKMSAAISLTSKNYHAQPSKILKIRTDRRTRDIHIDTWYDSAMQSLYALSLDPVAEAWADKKSFAFRRGRSSADLHESIKEVFHYSDWALVADVERCYERISHDWIAENIPLAPSVLYEFLGAGYVYGQQLFPKDEGVGVGLRLSPIIANMVLDGLQDYIFRALYPGAFLDEPIETIDYTTGNLIRFADDIIVVAQSRADAERIQQIVSDFLRPRGLELSARKTRIININDGFNFASRFYVKQNGVLFTCPSDSAIEKFKIKTAELIRKHTGSQRTLIMKLNKRIDGFATYHKIEQATDAFRHLDTCIQAYLLDSCQSKHPKWSMNKILNRYWYEGPDGRHRYALPDNKEIYVKFLSDTVLVQHKRLRLGDNPYIQLEYFNERLQTREIRNVTGIYKAIWTRQNGRCYHCGCRILRDQERTLTVVDSTARKSVQRYAYIHVRCTDIEIESIDTDILPTSSTDVVDLLKKINRNTNTKPSDKKYFLLSEFFRTYNRPSVTLTFTEIEDILQAPLVQSAATQRSWWHRTGYDCISQSWLGHGYEIKKLDLENKKVSFHQFDKNYYNAAIPDVLLSHRIPVEAKYELERYCAYLVKKYGL